VIDPAALVGIVTFAAIPIAGAAWQRYVWARAEEERHWREARLLLSTERVERITGEFAAIGDSMMRLARAATLSAADFDRLGEALRDTGREGESLGWLGE